MMERRYLNFLVGNKVSIVLAFLLIGFAFLVVAESQGDLEAELVQLEGELGELGYNWLVDYNISYPSIEVYREGDNKSVAVFENVGSEGWYKIYLSNLSANESLDTFDLRVECGGDGQWVMGNSTNIGCGVEFDYIVDPTITISDVSGGDLVNVTAESGASNHTHLNISNSAPYDSLVGYWSFVG